MSEDLKLLKRSFCSTMGFLETCYPTPVGLRSGTLCPSDN